MNQANEILYGIILNQDYIIRELLDDKLVKNINEILDYTSKILSEELGGNSDLIELVEKQKKIITDLDESFGVSDIDSFLEYSEDLIEQYDYLS
jgi:hypothetical protein